MQQQRCVPGRPGPRATPPCPGSPSPRPRPQPIRPAVPLRPSTRLHIRTGLHRAPALCRELGAIDVRLRLQAASAPVARTRRSPRPPPLPPTLPRSPRCPLQVMGNGARGHSSLCPAAALPPALPTALGPASGSFCPPGPFPGHPPPVGSVGPQCRADTGAAGCYLEGTGPCAEARKAWWGVHVQGLSPLGHVVIRDCQRRQLGGAPSPGRSPRRAGSSVLVVLSRGRPARPAGRAGVSLSSGSSSPTSRAPRDR